MQNFTQNLRTKFMQSLLKQQDLYKTSNPKLFLLMKTMQGVLERKKTEKKNPQLLLILDFKDFRKVYQREYMGSHITSCEIDLDDDMHSDISAVYESKSDYEFRGLSEFVDNIEKYPAKLDEYLSTNTEALPPIIKDVILPKLDEFKKSLNGATCAKLTVLTGGHGRGGDGAIYSYDQTNVSSSINIANLCSTLMLIAQFKDIHFNKKSLILESCQNLATFQKGQEVSEKSYPLFSQIFMMRFKFFRKAYTDREILTLEEFNQRYPDSFAYCTTYCTHLILKNVNSATEGFTQITGSEYNVFSFYSNISPFLHYKSQPEGVRKKIRINYLQSEETPRSVITKEVITEDLSDTKIKTSTFEEKSSDRDLRSR